MRPVRFTEFARDVLHRQYTPAQLVFAKVTFDGTDPCQLDGQERALAREIFGDVDTVPPDARRVLVAYFGRDSFKSGLAIDFALYRMAVADVSSVGPGEVPLVVGVSPDLKTTRLMIRRALALVNQTPELAGMLVEESSTGFVLRRKHDGRQVGFEAIAASRGGASLRGRPILLLILDEADFFYSGDAYVKTDDEIFRAGMPRLMRDGSALAITTPWGDESRTRKYFSDNFGDPKTALCARASTLLMRNNDRHVAANVEAEMASDPDNARREFFCQLTSIGSTRFFPSDVIEGAIDHDLVLPISDRAFDAIAGGWDLAQVRDSACQVLVGRLNDHHTVVSMRELRPAKNAPLKLSLIVATFAEEARPFGVTDLMSDGHAREPAREFTAPLGIRIVDAPTGQAGKVETHLFAKKLLSEGRCTIPSGRLPAQLKMITATPTTGGGLSIKVPRRAGSHGDLASAWILAICSVGGSGARPTRLAPHQLSRLRQSARFDGCGRRGFG
jgi:hypothetical protein